MFPPLPTWETAHPIVVHLPLGILAVVPVLALWAMFAGANRRTVACAVLIVLIAGAAGAALAAASGKAAMEVADVPGGAGKILDRHEDLGILARNSVLALTLAYAILTITALILRDRLKRILWIIAHLVWLTGFAAALLVLVNAGHLGGRLVHEYGVHAPMHEGGTPPPPPADDADK